MVITIAEKISEDLIIQYGSLFQAKGRTIKSISVVVRKSYTRLANSEAAPSTIDTFRRSFAKMGYDNSPLRAGNM